MIEGFGLSVRRERGATLIATARGLVQMSKGTTRVTASAYTLAASQCNGCPVGRSSSGRTGGATRTAGGRSSGSTRGGQRWFDRHVNDAHVQRAAADGYRSRAVYKLEELDRRDGLLRPGSRVLELGAAPGGWTQYVAERVGPTGRIVASDLLEVEPVVGMQFVQGDFTDAATEARILCALGEDGADLVLSDMAPNLSGVAGSDQARSMALVELAFDMAVKVLAPGGALVVKAFQGEGFDPFVQELRRVFRSVRIRKPEASRSRSREVYLVAVDPHRREGRAGL